MHAKTNIFLVLILCLAAWGCASPLDYQPVWAIARPTEEGMLYGVGTCGRAYTPERARRLAIQRAVAEIAYQALGTDDYTFEVQKESEDHTLTVKALLDGRTARVIEGVEVADEVLYPASDGWHERDTIYVLVRIPASSLPF